MKRHIYNALIYGGLVAIGVIVLLMHSRLSSMQLGIAAINNPELQQTMSEFSHLVWLAAFLSTAYMCLMVWLYRIKDKAEEEKQEEILRRETTQRKLEVEQAFSADNAKLMALGEMAGGVAHEINNPLAIILVSAEILKESLVKNESLDKSVQIVDKIITTSNRIAKIVKGLRAFSRNGDKDPITKVRVGEVVDETFGLCSERFKVHGISLKLKIENSQVEFDCRRVQIIQVLINLLNNAYDAVEKLPERWVELEVKDAGANIEFHITDSGHGIPESVKKKLYQPFFTTKEVGKGTGLGLSISQGLVRSHNGRIWIDETNPHTSFVVGLPKVAVVESNLGPLSRAS